MRVWHARALALREGAAFFHCSTGACPRDVERFMKHPQIIETACYSSDEG